MKLRRLQRQVCRQISGSPWLSLPSLSSISTSHIKLSFQSSKSGSKSGHNGVQFFISHLPSGLRTRRFREPTFRPSGATNHWKNTVFRDFFTFSRTWIFFLLRLSLWFDILSSFLLFSSLTLPTSAFHLSSFVHIVGSLTSKLPSTSYLFNLSASCFCPLCQSRLEAGRS